MTKSWVLFSDGACSGNPGPGGWAYILISPEGIVYEGGGAAVGTTNNRMEMTSILEGLRIFRQKARIKNLDIYTDSTYVIRGATQWIFGWRKRDWKNMEGHDVANRDIWEEFSPLLNGLEIKWNYVRGHTGIVGNERCDEIAVAFSKGEQIWLHRDVKVNEYPFSILPLPTPEPLPEMKSGSSAAKKPICYLSYVNGVVERHPDWKSCEFRVKGKSGARFKKIHTAQEEAETLKAWGVG